MISLLNTVVWKNTIKVITSTEKLDLIYSHLPVQWKPYEKMYQLNCNCLLNYLTPKSLVEGSCLRSPGAATTATFQGARTLTWPGQPASKPQAPCARPPPGTHHTQARYPSGKKLLKKGGIGRKHWEPLNYYNSTNHTMLTEQ